MNMHRLFLFLLFAIVISACGTEDNATGSAPATVAESAPAPATAPEEATVVAEAEPAPATAEESPIVVAEADGAAPEAAAASANWQYSAGKHYSQLGIAKESPISLRKKT